MPDIGGKVAGTQAQVGRAGWGVGQGQRRAPPRRKDWRWRVPKRLKLPKKRLHFKLKVTVGQITCGRKGQ